MLLETVNLLFIGRGRGAFEGYTCIYHIEAVFALPIKSSELDSLKKISVNLHNLHDILFNTLIFLMKIYKNWSQGSK